jgi:hypothetical protein
MVPHNDISKQHPYILNVAWVCYEIALPMSYLVSSVTTFLLIPGAKARGVPTTNFYKFIPLLFHNFNIIFMTIESIINQVPFEFNHFPFIAFYAVAYVVHSWILVQRLGIFIYFFLDYDKPYAIVWYLALVAMV